MSSNGNSTWLYKAFLISKRSKHVAKGLSTCQHFQHPQDCDPFCLCHASYLGHSSLCPFIFPFLNLLIVIPPFFSPPCPSSSTIQSATQKAVSYSLSTISFFSFLWTSLLPWIAEMGKIKEKQGINKIEKHKHFFIIKMLQWLFSLRSRSASVQIPVLED